MGLFFNKKKDVTVSPIVTRLCFEVANLQGQGKRENQEDAFCVANVFDEIKMKEQGLLFAVCDGMGGLNNGREAADTAIDIIRKDFKRMDRKADISKQLRQSLKVCSDAIFDKYRTTSGSTGIVGVIFDNKLHFASVGDSFLLLKRNNDIIRLNEAHNLGNRIYEDCIAEDNWNPFLSRNNSQNASLTAYLGMESLNRIDSTVRPIKLIPGDVLLACSDGVGAFVDENELKDLLQPSDAVESSRKIEQILTEKDNANQDNYTAIVICVR